MTVKERMLKYLSYRKLGQNAFEREAGITIGYINKVKNTITTPILEKILKVSPDLNRDWLLYGEGKMLKEELSNNNTIANVKGNNNILSSGDSNNITYHNLSECEKEVELLRMQIKHLEEKIVQKDVLLSEKERMIQMLINK